MRGYFKALDRFAAAMTRRVIEWRWLVILAAVAIAGVIGWGATKLELSTNYRVFFSAANPELQAFEDLQNTYTKNDNFLFVVEPRSGQAFDRSTAAAVEELTRRAWQIPYAIRVDSVSNFQHTHANDDELIVEDLVKDASSRDASYLDARRDIALAEPLIRDQLLTPNAAVTAVNVVLQYPEMDPGEVPEAVAYARDLRADIESGHPDLAIHLTGVSMLNNAFAETGMSDATTLIPMMFVVIFILTWLIVRSFAATLSTMLVIVLSTMVAMGAAGFAGIKMTPIALSAPVVILTLAVADSIHIVLALRGLMREGMQKSAALVEAMRVNFLPVAITSLTTIVGFLALNSSDSPPYWHLGNITAVGVAVAWVYSVTLLPALISALPYRVRRAGDTEWSQRTMEHLASFVIRHYRTLFVVVGLATLAVIAFIPTLRFNDQWVEYFDQSVEFRRDSDAVQGFFGLYPIEYSVPAMGPGGVSEPQYLAHLEELTRFMREQPHVTHVYSLSDIMKRLNRNMHGDDPAYYRIPDDRDLSAQYLLLYELSLPYGLDLNDRINIDKSATRVTATMDRASSAETRQFFANVDRWMQENLPQYMHTKPTSAAVMFTYISERNLRNMVMGTLLAVAAIAVIMTFTLQSVRLGILSLVTNGLPILATFGAWALLVGEVGFSIASVASIALGIIVDDTVHLLAKYVRARNESHLSIENSLRYAFRSVGFAIIVNTIILTAGFLVMTTSAFKMNVDLGLMTVLSIAGALILDFLFLPALLLLGRSEQELKSANQPLPAPVSAA
jgi:uncharacterized protein